MRGHHIGTGNRMRGGVLWRFAGGWRTFGAWFVNIWMDLLEDIRELFGDRSGRKRSGCRDGLRACRGMYKE